MAQCLTPFYKRDGKKGVWLALPCSQCYTCKMRKVNGWAFRLDQEFKLAQSAHFLTLTYDTEFIPINEHLELTLQKSDLQKLFKRIRKENPESQLKYFACGEYGTKTGRPHYHAIVFNETVQAFEKAWTDVHTGKPRGAIHRGDVEPASIYYTLKYMLKSQMRDEVKKQKEFQLMSKGLGKNYLTDQSEAWHKADLAKRYYLPVPGNVKCPMPRYYKDMLYDEHEKSSIGASIRAAIEKDEPISDRELNERVMTLSRKLKRTQLSTDKI